MQDEWRPKANLTVTAGLRVDVPRFGNTAFDNPAADALTFRDQDGSPVQLQQRRAAGDDALLVAARRLELGRQRRCRDAGARRHRPLLRQAAVRLDFEPDRQHRRALRVRPDRTTRPRSRSTRVPTKYKPARDRRRGAPATSSTSPIRASASRRRGARTSASTARLPWGLVGTLDYIYNRDRQRAGLPQRQPAGGRNPLHTGVDNRPRWVDRLPPSPACAPAEHIGGCCPASEQHAGQPGDGGLRHQEPERELVAEHLGRADEER